VGAAVITGISDVTHEREPRGMPAAGFSKKRFTAVMPSHSRTNEVREPAATWHEPDIFVIASDAV
jgi:hypothetical protein